MTLSEAVGREERQRRRDLFRSIVIEHPRKAQLHHRISMLMDDTAAAIAKHEAKRVAAGGRPVKAEELWILPVVGPSGATKSKSADTFIQQLYEDDSLSPDDIPVLTVSLRSSSVPPKQLQAQILEAYEDPSAASVLADRDYSEAAVNESIREIARRKKTTVVILDECHTPVVATQGRNAKVMGALLKSFVNDGLFSLVLMGTNDMLPVLRQPEVASRLKLQVDFDRFGTSSADIDYFLVFVAKLEDEMVEYGVIDLPIGLTDDSTIQAMVYEMADGVIGTVSRILERALDLMLEAGRTEMTLEDVRDGFIAWVKLADVKRRNPFLAKGPSREILAAMLKAEKDAAAKLEAADVEGRPKAKSSNRKVA
jgi:hypothetical protein